MHQCRDEVTWSQKIFELDQVDSAVGTDELRAIRKEYWDDDKCISVAMR